MSTHASRRMFLLASCFALAAVSFAQLSPHGPARFACGTCHVTASSALRTDSLFDHRLTGFVLTERHQTIECATCHKEKKFSLRETNCVSCHPDVHKNKLGETCAQCHVTQAWLGAEMMRQHEKGRFVLTGAHEAIPCKQCHVDGNFRLVYTGCRPCHEGLFPKTRSPDHVAANFGYGCDQCHSTGNWRPSIFDHGTTRFPLTGAHATMRCTSCHVNDNYTLHYTDCFPCHEHRFTQSLNPNHVAANFPHDCYPCHSTTAWRPSTFAHDQLNFPIFRGKHRDQWVACSDCHQNTANFASFSCLNCHGEAPTDQGHVNIAGYSYASPACYSCHRDV